MSNLPLVSICVPTYNTASTVRETLISILAQTYPNFVVHISDNASTDDTVKVIESLDDPRIIIHLHEINVGGEGNFNRCIQLAEGKYTAIFHADDIYEPEMVEKQVAFLEVHSEAGAVFTEACLIDKGGNKIGAINVPKKVKVPGNLYQFEKIFKAVLCYSNFFVCPSFFVRTEFCKQNVQKWRGDLFKTSADLDVWFRVLQHTVIGIIPEKLMRYRISVGQYSQNLRLRVTRSDLFLVLDYYLKQNEIKNMLSTEDWVCYHQLERTDRVVRAVNLYLQGQEFDAIKLCQDAWSAAAFRGAGHGRRGLFTFIAGVLLRFCIDCHLPTIGRFLFNRLKLLARK